MDIGTEKGGGGIFADTLLAYVMDRGLLREVGRFDRGDRITVDVVLDQGADASCSVCKPPCLAF